MFFVDITYKNVIGKEDALDIDAEMLSNSFKGKRVLVSGAGGTIGSEITRRLDSLGVSDFVALDRDENSLHSLQLSIGATALFDDRRFVLCDIRNYESCLEVFQTYSPDIVIHAAALKHLSALERFPKEALLTNVMGTFNLLEASRNTGLEDFINVSTDKAANPTSVLGASKRITELLTMMYAKSEFFTSRSVRFGNVFASRGSVIETFTSQIANNKPVTLTDLGVERYFMSVFEAALLVLETKRMDSNRIYLLEMGKPVLLGDIARRLMEIMNKEVPVAITGLRPGEKLSEDLLGNNENALLSTNPSIQYVEYLDIAGTLDFTQTKIHAQETTNALEFMRELLRTLEGDSDAFSE